MCLPPLPCCPPLSAAAAYITGQTYAIDGGKGAAVNSVHVVRLVTLRQGSCLGPNAAVACAAVRCVVRCVELLSLMLPPCPLLPMQA